MPLSPEDLRLGQLLRARGLVPESVLLDCAREGDAHEAQGRPRPRLGAQLVARRALAPEQYARFLASSSESSGIFRASGTQPSLGASGAQPGLARSTPSARLAASGAQPGLAQSTPSARIPAADPRASGGGLASSGVGPGISRAASPPTPPIGTTPSPDTPSWRSRSSGGDLPQVGSVVGPYRLEGELGKGGMGAVYRGRHERTGAVVAVKVLARKAGGQTAERFEREVQAFAKLRHPNVVSIHESGEAPLYLWYSMEIVEGSSLEKLIADKKTERDALVKLVLQVARGMEHAHSRGVIHRDLKPSNVLVTPDGVARVTDFGAARHLDRETRLTADGSVIGTPYYMSPEQVTGSTDQIDERSDVWALGVMLYEAVTGTLPFEDEQPLALCAKICESDPERPRARSRTVSPDLEAVVVRALAKSRDERYATMGAFATDLERYLKGERVSASQITLASEIVRQARKRPWRLLGAFAVFVLGVAAVTVVVVARRREKGSGGGSELVQEAEREAGRALEKIRAGKLPTGDALALANATLGRLDDVCRSPRAEADRKRLEGWPVRIELAVLRARALAAEGAEADARAALEALGEIGAPVDAEVALALGDACLALGDAPAALAAFERAARRAPERWEPLLGRARARVLARRDVSAASAEAASVEAASVEADLGHAREKQAPSGLVETVRAELQAREGDRAHALERLDQVVKTDPALAAPRIARATLVRETGDDARALEDLRKAADRDPQAARLEAAWHLEAGALPDAARAYERVLALVPEDVSATVALAEVRASLGDLDHASAGLVRDAIPLAESRGRAGRPSVLAYLRALAPIEGARGGWSEAFAVRLDAAGLTADAALVRAELAGDVGRARGVLEGAAEASHVPEDKARLLAALSLLRRESGENGPARELADAAVAAVPSSGVAHAARSGALAAAGSVRDAAAERATARAARSPSFLRALAEARADALIALAGAGPGIASRRAEEARRSNLARFGFRALGPPSPELLARAERELRYVARLDPFAPEPPALLARLALAAIQLERGVLPCDSDPLAPKALAEKLSLAFIGGKSPAQAVALARTACRVDPLDPEAAAVLLLSPTDSKDHTLTPATRAAAEANPSDVRLQLARARMCIALNDEKDPALDLVRKVAREHPDDREVLNFAVSILTFANDPTAPELERRLETLDAAFDLARTDVLATLSIENTDLTSTLAKLEPALAVAPDDVEVLRGTIEKAKSHVKAHGADWSRVPPLLCGRLVLLSGHDTGEVVKWLDTLRPYVSPEDEAEYRRLAAEGTPRERLEAATAIALVDAEEPVNYDSRKLQFQRMSRGAPSRECLARLAPVVAGAPGSPLVRGLAGVQLARSGRMRSAAREVERFLGWREPTFNDLWLAAAVHVLGADYEGGAKYALRSANHPEKVAGDKRDFVDYAPFLEAAKRQEWAEVVALQSK